MIYEWIQKRAVEQAIGNWELVKLRQTEKQISQLDSIEKIQQYHYERLFNNNDSSIKTLFKHRSSEEESTPLASEVI